MLMVWVVAILIIGHLRPPGSPAGYTDATLRIGHYNCKDLHWTATVGQRVSMFTL